MDESVKNPDAEKRYIRIERPEAAFLASAASLSSSSAEPKFSLPFFYKALILLSFVFSFLVIIFTFFSILHRS